MKIGEYEDEMRGCQLHKKKRPKAIGCGVDSSLQPLFSFSVLFPIVI
jgi:hypothetical protein